MQLEDILYERKAGVARVIINRPRLLNAFRARTLKEMAVALEDAAADATIGVVVISGAGGRAFSTGGDATEVSGQAGYSPEMKTQVARVHGMIRTIPQPVIAMVSGYAVGGGNVLQAVCDLTIASETARFGQVGPKVGSFDAGFGSAYLARVVGEKKAREMWYLCRLYTAQEALEMGLVNKVVPAAQLEAEVDAWCQEILAKSPTALKFLKASFNADTDHIAGIEALSMDALWLYYGTDEALEARQAYLQKRPPDFRRFRK